MNKYEQIHLKMYKIYQILTNKPIIKNDKSEFMIISLLNLRINWLKLYEALKCSL